MTVADVLFANQLMYMLQNIDNLQLRSRIHFLLTLKFVNFKSSEDRIFYLLL